MIVNDYLHQLTDEKRIEILSILNLVKAWNSSYENLVRNIYIESCFTQDDWDELFSQLVCVEKKQLRLIACMQSVFQKRQLMGDPAQVPSKLFGRIRSLNRFLKELVNLGYYMDKDEAEADISKKIGMEPDEIRRINPDWDDLLISENNMWSTFDISGGDPFAYSENKDDIVCSLGLDPIDGLVLAFIYTMPSTVQPTIPTICDAFAWSINEYFRRAAPSSAYGMTASTDHCGIQGGRPEVIHTTISAINLQRPMSFL